MIRFINKYKYTITFVIVCFFMVNLIFLIFISSIPFNPIQYKLSFVKNKVFTFTPQGWAFFTRNPREEQIYIYRIDNNGRLSRINQKHSNFDNIMGLDRKVSKISVEVQYLTSNIHKSEYTETIWNYDENIFGKVPSKYISVINPINNPLLCGNYLIVKQKIVPWAWWSTSRKVQMPSTVVKIQTKCIKK